MCVSRPQAKRERQGDSRAKRPSVFPTRSDLLGDECCETALRWHKTHSCLQETVEDAGYILDPKFYCEISWAEYCSGRCALSGLIESTTIIHCPVGGPTESPRLLMCLTLAGRLRGVIPKTLGSVRGFLVRSSGGARSGLSSVCLCLFASVCPFLSV